jgi:hypothetical protein
VPGTNVDHDEAFAGYRLGKMREYYGEHVYGSHVGTSMLQMVLDGDVRVKTKPLTHHLYS